MIPTALDFLPGLADQPEVWLLAGPWTMLAWDVEPVAIGDLALDDAPGRPEGRGWGPFPDHGGLLVQQDYDGTPVAVRPRSWMQWDPDGRLHIHGVLRLPRRIPARQVRLADGLTPVWDGASHARVVEQLRGHIAAGDVYQVNLTVPMDGTLAAGDDLAVGAALLRSSPAPFAAVVRRRGRPTIISHSPECLLSVSGTRAMTCPIKGTRPSGRRDELLTSAKDAAELAMIVDLMRNDLGRLAEPGTVGVPTPSRILDLPYAHHLVADVVANLRLGTRWSELFEAVAPAGSITGAPKGMARTLIRRYEPRPRGPYCGSFGWIAPSGGQLAVAIRTLTVDGDRVTVHAGSGIVADSDGEAEWDEVRTKASAMAAALGAVL